jgi:chromatin structure-remodeling complex subunit RSC1/2
MIKPIALPKLGHSLKYLASKEERQKKVAEHKRKRAADSKDRDEEAKRLRADEETALAARIEALAPKAINAMVKEVASGTDQLYKFLYEEKADSARAADIETRDTRMNVDRENHHYTAEIQARSANPGFVNLKGDAMYLGQDQGQTQDRGEQA